MTNEIRPIFASPVDMTITLASIAAGNGRISAQVDNTTTRFNLITVYARIESGGTGPADEEVYEFYLIKFDADTPEYVSDGFSDADAAVTVKPPNANFIGAIAVTNDADTQFFGDFVVRDPGPEFSIVFWNDTGQTISTTEADSFIHFIGQNDRVEDSP